MRASLPTGAQRTPAYVARGRPKAQIPLCRLPGDARDKSATSGLICPRRRRFDANRLAADFSRDFCQTISTCRDGLERRDIPVTFP